MQSLLAHHFMAPTHGSMRRHTRHGQHQLSELVELIYFERAIQEYGLITPFMRALLVILLEKA
jgi:hypothetical protein